ncbi:MAG TPA: hypothetical protein GX530_06015 [Corynebacteriales bacterium]|nr:hypothetical protein [Mycobacteriales bacterium]
MKLDLAELKAASTKILNISNELSLSESSIADSINYADSSLVSVQSFLDQLRAILAGNNGLLTLLKWHKGESDVVSASLKDLAGLVDIQDADLSAQLDGFYRARGAEQEHSPFYMPEMTSLGKGFKTKDGRRFHTLTGHGIPLVEEPLGRDVETLATEFARAPIDLVLDVQRFSHKQAKIVENVSYEIHKVAQEVMNSGSSDAFTYEAGRGIHRWADSMSELGNGFRSVQERTGTFATAVNQAQAEFEEIASERKSTKSADQAAFQEAKFIEKANKVISGSYNPGIQGADTKSVEFAMPMRAVRPEEIPFPGEPGFPGSGRTGGAAGTGISSMPNASRFSGVMPQDSSPQQPTPAGSQQGPIEVPDAPNPEMAKPPTTNHPTPTGPSGPLKEGTPAPGQGVAGYTPPAGTNAATFNPTPQPPGTVPGTTTTMPTPDRGTLLGQTPGGQSGGARGPQAPGVGPYWQGTGAGGSAGSGAAPNAPKAPGSAGNIPSAPRAGGSGAARPGAANAGARGGAAGMRGMGMMGAPGTGGAGDKQGGKGFKRTRRSAKNTRKILRLDEQEQTLYGVIRHPKDPLFGTGR